MGKCRFDDVNVRCPFYIGSTNTVIICEGVADGSVLENKFRDMSGKPMKDKRDAHKHKYCDCLWEQCPIYKALEEKYE